MDSFLKTLTTEIVISNKRAESIIKILFFSFLTFIGSLLKIYLPYTPVPVTLQTFFLFLSVYYLNPKETGISQSIYILAGLVGLPVFAAGLTGMIALTGPTAGYLLGFIISGVIMSFLKQKVKPSFLNMFCIFTLGMIIYLFFGTLHLSVIYKINVINALKIGVIPFIAGDVLKIITASLVCLKNKNK
ncbi:MAG: biotin transporter BioY [Candidatus Goldbacteria bacterium]|nr:biotin transporter BioY [Candidatus Goldiibacteriota bacterium]